MAKSFMQKQEVIAVIAQRTGLTRDQVTSALSAYAGLIAEELVSTGGINLPDLGRAKVIVRKAVAARQSVNPRTREPMTIPAVPAKKTYRAKFGKDFLSRVKVLESTPPSV